MLHHLELLCFTAENHHWHFLSFTWIGADSLMDEFVLIPLSYYKHLTSKHHESVQKDVTIVPETTLNNLPPSNGESMLSHVPENEKTDSWDGIVNTGEKRWLQNVINSQSNTSISETSTPKVVEDPDVSKLTTRKRRIQSILDLLIKCKEITFNTSTSSFNISPDSRSIFDSPEGPTETTLNILTFLRNLQLYQKKVPENYFPVLDLLFPPTGQDSVTKAKELVINRNCLSYILNRNVHEQREADLQ